MDYSDGFDSYSAAALGGQGSWVNTSFTGLYVYKPASDGEVYPNASGARCCAYYNGTIENEQYSKCTVAAIGHTSSIGVAVRCSSNSFYGWYSNDIGSILGKMVSGSWTTLATGDPFSIGENRTLEIVGSTLKCYRNSVLDTSINGTGMIGDSSISSGYVGICGFGANNSSRIDTWEAGSALTLIESHDEIYDGELTCTNGSWYAMAFYVGETGPDNDFVITKVKIYARRGSSGSSNTKVRILYMYGTTAVVLSDNTIDTTGWSTTATWHEISIIPASVAYGSRYFISIGTTDSGSVLWTYDDTTAVGGSRIWLSADNGSTYPGLNSGNYTTFEIWGYEGEAGIQLPARYKEFSKI